MKGHAEIRLCGSLAEQPAIDFGNLSGLGAPCEKGAGASDAGVSFVEERVAIGGNQGKGFAQAFHDLPARAEFDVEAAFFRGQLGRTCVVHDDRDGTHCHGFQDGPAAEFANAGEREDVRFSQMTMNLRLWDPT